ncbi:lactate utilization protein C [uncultured Veillonella sp.]|uniref:LutC/YkgG family protein n=1 Tax=uncultured Veillonella sp. TaxID=159268 RepID=UPI00260F85D9|nr:lactate utilization protein C [uncultured Veillonella sp.]
MDEAKRKAFFSRISHALGRKEIPSYVVPFPYEQGPQADMYSELSHEQVVDMFKAECEKVGTKYITTDKAHVVETLLNEIKERGGGKVIYPSSQVAEDYKLEEAFSKVDPSEATFFKWVGANGREANINEAKVAEIGITFPIAGIAETATVIQPSNEESGRSIGLLPLCHIAVINTNTIMPRMTQTMAKLTEVYKENPTGFPSNVVHISGPSNTADIELVRVVGVHGPINVTFILVD